MTVSCNDPRHEARREMERRAERYSRYPVLARLAEQMADRTYGTPCIICGAPINSAGEGHDPDCMGPT